MIFPSAFITNVTKAFGEPGRSYLSNLPHLISIAAQRWHLTIGDPFLLSYNYVCAATRLDDCTTDPKEVVLKIGVPNRELTSEINSLRVYGGQGACRLLEADAEAGMLLLERICPGTMLATLKNDDRATEIAADVMRRIQRPLPEENGFLHLEEWFDDLRNMRLRFGGGTGPFPEKTVDVVEGLLDDLLADDCPQFLLHGDFHHFNILYSERGWLVIDPKGVIGPADYEIGPLLLNPWGKIPDEAEAVHRTRRRIDILTERLGFDRHRLWAWAACHSLLSAWWDLADDGTGGEYSLAWTEIFLRMRI
jgi:streptomycin 6-kinase